MAIPKELKEAISQLTSDQKDKLIYRLLRKDQMLANRLLFELVSDDSVEQRRNELKDLLKRKIEAATLHFHSAGYLNMDVREMSGMITEHVSITKDKYGEILLNLWMTAEILEKNNQKILNTSYGKAYKFYLAIVARVFKIMLLVNKLHEDYRVDFEDDLKRLGFAIQNNPYLTKVAIEHGLDTNWLTRAELPANLEEIYKNLRAR